MEQMYDSKMKELGYDQLVCDIFANWEDVKDEILVPDRKQGTGNGTVHVFLGAADAALRKEFPAYYDSVTNGEDTSIGAVRIKHYFLATNVLSMLGFACRYCYSKHIDFERLATNILKILESEVDESGLLSTESFFKLSTGSAKLRPYFKQFDDKGIFHKVIRLLLLPDSSYKISLFKNEEGEYAALWLIGFNYLSNFEADSNDKYTQGVKKLKAQPLQQIFYGAPGTGKSRRIKNDEKVKAADEKNLVFRTTFHPDSDYSTFVGAYKPTIAKRAVRNVAGDIVKDTEKADVYEDCITYSFVPQAFLQAYVAAWNHQDENVFLVIEEINRGNCAQIFGDLFQLLDRDDEGYSEYPIKADIDLARYLKEGKDEDGQEVLMNKDGIKDKKLRLPKNLYIWATMNTSDQSLFPIDSAFKRRWEWVYQPIDTAKETWYVKVGEKYYSWTAFLNKVNDELLTDETAEDKHLGFYFCKATEKKAGTETKPNVVTAETFVGKVLFYLWNDVFKVYGIPSSIGSSKDWPYRKFYLTNGEVDKEKVAKLMAQLKIDTDAAEEPQPEEE